jgi:hypothetical protein
MALECFPVDERTAPLPDDHTEGRSIGDAVRHPDREYRVRMCCGTSSANLVCIEAVDAMTRTLAPHCLPVTGLTVGRGSLQPTTFLYRAEPLPSTETFVDPASGEPLVTILSEGATTWMPPSEIAPGVRLHFIQTDRPAYINGDLLRDTAARLKAISLLARHWPVNEGRHELAAALEAWLEHCRWEYGSIKALLAFVTYHPEDLETCREVLKGRIGSSAGSNFHRVQQQLAAMLGPEIWKRVESALGDDPAIKMSPPFLRSRPCDPARATIPLAMLMTNWRWINIFGRLEFGRDRTKPR